MHVRMPGLSTPVYHSPTLPVGSRLAGLRFRRPRSAIAENRIRNLDHREHSLRLDPTVSRCQRTIQSASHTYTTNDLSVAICYIAALSIKRKKPRILEFLVNHDRSSIKRRVAHRSRRNRKCDRRRQHERKQKHVPRNCLSLLIVSD
jgi:hypothetical protein